jgi:hypothetical protein
MAGKFLISYDRLGRKKSKMAINIFHILMYKIVTNSMVKYHGGQQK